MKKFMVVGLIILVLAGLTACEATTVTVTSIEQQQNQINELTAQLNGLQSEMDALQAKYDTAAGDLATSQGQANDLNAEMAALQAEYDALQELYDSLAGGVGPELRNPTWAELKAFVTQDKTDTIRYNIKTFACVGYTTLVRDNAHALGFRGGFIQISFNAGAGHAFNVFQTSDYGPVYIDCTGNAEGGKSDKVGYLLVGQLYQTIPLSVVQTEYISCDGDPGEFWQPLTYKTASNPFSYEYFTEYAARRAFQSSTIQAFNEAVNEYNAHTGGWTESQLTQWTNNINVLKTELGSLFYEPMGVVTNIEAYWGNN